MSPQVLVSAEHARRAEKGLRQKNVVALAAALGALTAMLAMPAVSALSVLGLAPGAYTLTAAAAAAGTIKGGVRIVGDLPGNRVIRMGMDPMCAAANAGKRPVNEIYAGSDNGGLGNVFLKVEGSFPQTPVPAQPVMLEQKACVYQPRVLGARVGQVLRVRNDDNWLHNVHSDSSKRNGFNVSEPKAGIQQDFTLKDEEMLRIGCDVHRWMTAWVGVVSHPYFAVSAQSGTFTIANVPAGKRTVTAWHESLGTLTKAVDVKAGETAAVEFVYTQKP
jgi:plastocyanin